MANCVNCGNGMNFLSETYPLWPETQETLCSRCRNKLDKIVKAHKIDFKAYNSVEEFIQLYAGMLKDEGFSDSGINYLGQYVDTFCIKKEAQERQIAQAELEAERERQRQDALAHILISSGFSFEGYRIVKYSGYISGDDAVQIPRSGVFGGNNGRNLTDALVRIRRQALKELKEAAYDMGCNAVIGVDFDYITIEPETANITGGTLYEPYIICVTANGNAVIIEKE